MDYNELYNEYQGSGLSLSAFAKERGLDKGNLSRAFKKLQQPTTGVVSDNDNVVEEDTTAVVPVVDCANCQQVINLTKQRDDLAHLQIDAPSCDSCARIAQLEKELAEERETIHVAANCDNCGKLSAVVSEREKMEKERDAAKSKLRALEEKYQGLENQYRSATSETTRLRGEVYTANEALQEHQNTSAARLRELEKIAKEWEKTATDYQREGEQKIKTWAVIAGVSILLFVGTLLMAIIK